MSKMKLSSPVSAIFKNNPLQFSVVREDPNIEISLFRKFNIQKPILIGSGGCTALSLASEFQVNSSKSIKSIKSINSINSKQSKIANSPSNAKVPLDLSFALPIALPIALIEPNPAQVQLIREKIKTLMTSSDVRLLRKFGVGSSSEECLIERGNFESLFRAFRVFIYEFISKKDHIEELLVSGTPKSWKKIFSHPYWRSAFDLFFHNSILRTMFGPAAIQHGPPESYSVYFRHVLEAGLLRDDRRHNYFLHHIFLGHYRKSKADWPTFLQNPPKRMNIKIFPIFAAEMKDYSPYDFVGLSNIFDWSSEKEVKILATKLNEELNKGAIVLYRQLNNAKNFRRFFGKNFLWLSHEAQKLHKNDRSLFYSSIHIARKVK